MSQLKIILIVLKSILDWTKSASYASRPYYNPNGRLSRQLYNHIYINNDMYIIYTICHQLASTTNRTTKADLMY